MTHGSRARVSRLRVRMKILRQTTEVPHVSTYNIKLIGGFVRPASVTTLPSFQFFLPLYGPVQILLDWSLVRYHKMGFPKNHHLIWHADGALMGAVAKTRKLKLCRISAWFKYSNMLWEFWVFWVLWSCRRYLKIIYCSKLPIGWHPARNRGQLFFESLIKVLSRWN